MSTLAASRALQALLQQLQGSPSTGIATVRSTGATGSVPGSSFAVPIVGGQAREDAVLFVPRNTAADGAWPVTAAGSSVPVESVQGGTHVNLPEGTVLRWLPALAGIESQSTLSTATTGGTRTGPLRQVRYFKDLGSQEKARALYNAQVHDYPAAVLAWANTAPADGSVQGSYGPQATRPGRGVRVFRAYWVLHLITSRLDTTDERTREGDQLRDDVLELLTDRVAVRGLHVSLEPGVQVQGARFLEVAPTRYLDEVTFSTAYSLRRRELPRPPGYESATWETSTLQIGLGGD